MTLINPSKEWKAANEAFEAKLAEQKYILGMPELANIRVAFVSGYVANGNLNSRISDSEHRLEVALTERNYERAKFERVMKIMTRVFSLCAYPPDIKLPDGRVMRFNDPNAAETLRLLSKAILAIPEAISSAEETTL